jgi:hypothetical protein
MKIIALALLALIPSFLNAEVIVDLMSIAGKTKNEVAQVLGEATPADSQNQSKHGERLFYRNGSFEIVYVNEIADWITITELKDLPFSPSSLKSLGFSKVYKPTFQNQNVIRWNLGKAIREISIFPGQKGKVWMISISVKTKP